jgi:hypothetical protein
VQDTVAKDGLPKFPPKASPAFCVPTPANLHLAFIKAPPADHVEPSYSSVHDSFPPPSFPPKASPAFCVPAPAKLYLAVDNDPPAIHDVPLYSSVHDTIGV